MDVQSLREFAELVAEMRESQRRYFRSRSTWELTRARDVERRVDEATRAILDRQPSLPLGD